MYIFHSCVKLPEGILSNLPWGSLITVMDRNTTSKSVKSPHLWKTNPIDSHKNNWSLFRALTMHFSIFSQGSPDFPWFFPGFLEGFHCRGPWIFSTTGHAGIVRSALCLPGGRVLTAGEVRDIPRENRQN